MRAGTRSHNSPADRTKATHAMAEALVKQPPPTREELLEKADDSIRGELEQQVKQITDQAAKDNPPAAEPPEPPAE